MKRPGLIRQQLPLWGLIIGLWGLLVIAFAGQLVFSGNLTWTRALTISLRDWYPWAFLTPAVAWLAFRFAFERGKLYLSIPIHVVACMLAMLICELLAPPLPLPSERPFRPMGMQPGGFPEAGPQGEFRQGVPPDQRSPFRPEGRPNFRPGMRPGLNGPGEAGDGSLPPLDSQPGGRPFEPNRPGLQGPPFRDGAMAGPLQRPRQAIFMEGLVRRARFNLPVYWIIFSLVQAFVWFRRSQERERSELALQARLAEARLESLRMQLHPHFLFNTLNAISTLVHKDPVAADEMIVNLSELLRATLDTREQQIPLRRELEFLDRYLEIQQVRFGNRLQIVKEIAPDTLEALVPTLILQPLTENSIRHGIEPQTGEGLVCIVARREGSELHLQVRDNGAGDKSAGPKNGEGIGLSNTRARLQELHGAAARLVASPAADQGFSVDLFLPFKEQLPEPVTAENP